ncbi:MAG TPA: hypothetical protein VFI55_06260 [Mycobacterium sp.]|nr:hypothetical protein [Mycobacterium sp.]
MNEQRIEANRLLGGEVGEQLLRELSHPVDERFSSGAAACGESRSRGVGDVGGDK